MIPVPFWVAGRALTLSQKRGWSQPRVGGSALRRLPVPLPLDIFSVVDCVHHREVSGDLPGIVRHAASISRTVLVRA